MCLIAALALTPIGAATEDVLYLLTRRGEFTGPADLDARLVCIDNDAHRDRVAALLGRTELRSGFRDLHDLAAAFEQGSCDALVGALTQLNIVRERAAEPRMMVIQPLSTAPP